MHKLTFEYLVIELTRKCNMTCAHCCRGDAQNVDIDLAHVDALLDQTELIGELFFTGGEPTLNLEAMEYILDQLYKRGIPLLNFMMITNGLIYSERFIEIIKQYSELVKLSREHCTGKNRVIITDYVQIGVSLDRYHQSPDLCKKNYEMYRKNLWNYADVRMMRRGNDPIRVGRGKCLPVFDTRDDRGVSEAYYKVRVELLDSEHTPACHSYDKYKMLYPEQKIVCCTVCLDANGYLRSMANAAYDYASNDSMSAICHVCDTDIWAAIIEYNKERVPCCFAMEFIKNNLSDPFGLYALKQLFTSEDSIDEPSRAQLRNKKISEKFERRFGGPGILELFSAINRKPTSWQDIIEEASKKDYLQKQD